MVLERSRSMIEQQLRHMVRLIDDLLDVSRITFNKLELRREPVALAHALEQAIETFLPMADRAGLNLQTDLPAEPVYVNADAARLVQIFGNLLSNACKFTPRGGTVRLAVARRSYDVIVSVSDTGIGVEPELLPKLFAMFAQADERVDHTQRGLGIGLALAQRLVQMHDGEITAHSDGQGRQHVLRTASDHQRKRAAQRGGP